MARSHFLCCLPVRLGALLFSFGDFISNAALAGLVWFVLIRNSQTHQLQMSKAVMIGFIAAGVVSSIIALTSLAGFIGAILGKVGGVRTFLRTISWLFGIQLVLSILGIVAIYMEPRDEFTKQCINGQTDQSIIDTCRNSVNSARLAYVIAAVIALCWHAYMIYIVGAYAKQLEEKEINRNIILGNSNSHSKYAPVGHGDDSKPFIAPDTSYPYADGAHSHGNTAYHHGGSYA